MSRMRNNCNAIFEKYTIYDKKTFLQIFTYVLMTIQNDTYVFEPEWVYMLLYYKRLFESVDNVDIFINILESIIPVTLPTIDIPDPYIINMGSLIDKFTGLLFKDELVLEDFSDYNITYNNNLYTINGISSTTLRGLVWKYLCCNLNKYLVVN